MISSKASFLKELFSHPELEDNIIAYVFAHNPDLNASIREKFVDYIMPYYLRYRRQKSDLPQIAEVDVSPIENWAHIDLRIKQIELNSIRGLPDSTIPFGIEFTNTNNEPESMIILGSNGSGKSTIYDAIEYSFCKTIGEAKIRNYTDDNLDFLRHFENGINRIFCKIETVSTTIDIQEDFFSNSIKKIINPETHFFSDFAIYSKGQLDFESSRDNSFHYTIAESLGLTELLNFERHLKLFTLYRRQTENRNITSLKRSVTTQYELIKTSEFALNEKAKQLEDLENNNKITNSDSNTKTTLLISEIKNNEFSIDIDYSQFSKCSEEFKLIFSDLSSRSSKVAGVNEIQYLNTGLELIKETEDCPFCNNSKLTKDEIVEIVNTRLSSILEMNSFNQKLLKSRNDLLDAFTTIKANLEITIGQIKREVRSIIDVAEFNDLSQINNELINRLSSLTNHTFFVEMTNLDDNANYLVNRDKYLFDVLQTNSEFIVRDIDEIKNEIGLLTAKRLDTIQRIDDYITYKNQILPSTERIIILKKEIKDLNKQILDAQENIRRDENDVQGIQEYQAIFEDIRSQTNEYLKILHNALSKEVDKSFAPIKLIVEEILEIYFNSDNRDVELIISKQPEETDEETGEVLSEIITAHIKHKSQNIPPQSVKKYFNTFHYRLFTTMVGISIAIASRINNRINLPIVIDDILYASDFENRVTIENLLTTIFKTFKRYTPDLPLQLILFTHDQLIFESTLRIATESETGIQFCKLYPHTEATNAGDYQNLVYKLPSYIPQAIIKSVLS